MPSLAEIRARIAAQDNKNNRQQQSQGDGAFYPHWKIEDGKSVTLRLLPDGNPANPDFWMERQMIRLTFNGVLGRPDMKRVEVQVPCIEMYGPEFKDACPVHQELRTWYKDKSLEEMANRYWKKRSYIYQGFVRQSSYEEPSTPENPIRRFLISPSLHKIIKASIMDPEIVELPTDYDRGLDFNIRKTTKGENADYSTSSFARRESELTSAERAAIEQHGLFKLNEFMPKQPNDAELRIIYEMFQESVDNKPYDPQRWGSYYKPWGLDAPAVTAQHSEDDRPRTSTVQESTEEYSEEPTPVTTRVEIPTAKAPVSSEKAQEILARLAARKTVA